MCKLCDHAQVVDTEVEVEAPEYRMGPVSDITAGTVTVKTESFPLPANALVSQISCSLGPLPSFLACTAINGHLQLSCADSQRL